MLKCFVACAFGKRDVDRIYLRAIMRASRAAGCEPVRVDKVEHNDDIDDKIYELIESSDLCLADLTYARPSVYYEAGIFHGMKKPVIYTVRSDHFKARDDDPFGNLRVHFDLQMKNIIGWKAGESAFAARLESRIRDVVAPVIKRREIDAAIATEEQEFSAEALGQRCRIVTDKAKRLLQRRGFTVLYPTSGIINPPEHFIAVRAGKRPVWVRVICDELMTVAKMRRVGNHGGLNDLEVIPEGKSEEARLHCVLVSMRAVSHSRVRDALPNFKADTKAAIPTYTKTRSMVAQLAVHVISPVRRSRDFESQFRSVLGQVEGTQ